MRVKLHFDYWDYLDEMTISANTLEELKAIANKEVAKRKPEHYWSSNFYDLDNAKREIING